jgi:hypothetical protein
MIPHKGVLVAQAVRDVASLIEAHCAKTDTVDKAARALKAILMNACLPFACMPSYIHHASMRSSRPMSPQVMPTHVITPPPLKTYTFIPMTGAIVCHNVAAYDMEEEATESKRKKLKFADAGAGSDESKKGRKPQIDTNESNQRKRNKIDEGHDSNDDDDVVERESAMPTWHCLFVCVCVSACV